MARYRKRDQRIHPFVWIGIGLVAVILFIIWFYIAIQRPLWLQREQARNLILNETDIVTLESIHPFIEEKKYFVASGKDENGQPMVVWLSDDDIYAAYIADNFPPALVRQRLLEEEPDAIIIRLVPGVYHEERAWEVFYKKEEAGGTRHYYTYYRFLDGEKLETYQLALEP